MSGSQLANCHPFSLRLFFSLTDAAMHRAVRHCSDARHAENDNGNVYTAILVTLSPIEQIWSDIALKRSASPLRAEVKRYQNTNSGVSGHRNSTPTVTLRLTENIILNTGLNSGSRWGNDGTLPQYLIYRRLYPSGNSTSIFNVYSFHMEKIGRNENF